LGNNLVANQPRAVRAFCGHDGEGIHERPLGDSVHRTDGAQANGRRSRLMVAAVQARTVRDD